MNTSKRNLKKITSIYLEEDMVIIAKEIGLNISKVCEIALKKRIELLSPLNKGEWWTGRDLNPRLPPCQGGDRTRLIYQPA